MRNQAVRGAAWERPVWGGEMLAILVAWFASWREWKIGLRTVCAAVVEEDVCVCVRLVLVLRVGLWDCDFVLVALAGA